MTIGITASVHGGELVLSAHGAALIRLRTYLRQHVPSDELRSTDGGIQLPLAYANILSGLPGLDWSHSIDAKQAVERRSIEVAEHLQQLANIRDALEGSLSATGDVHFDALLDPHQGIAANCIALPGLQGLCIFDEQGTGKTLSATAGYCLLREHGRVARLIIVSPLSVFGDWKAALTEHAGAAGRVVELSGGGTPAPLLYGHNEVALTTFQSATRYEKELRSFAQAAATLLIVDESYVVKNPDAQTSEAVARLRTACVRGLALCGTPAPNRPADIINQFDIADGGVCFQGFHLPDSEDDRAEAIRSVIGQRGAFIRRTKEEVLPDLAAKHFSLVQVPLSGRQRSLYDEAHRLLLLHLRSLDNRSFKRHLATYFQRRAALLQICVSPQLVDPTFSEQPAKYVRLDVLLADLVDAQHKKVVLWSAYTRTIDDVMARYAHYHPVRIDGTVPDPSVRSEAISQFQNDPSVMLFVGNPAAAGAGITLHAASDAIYLSFSSQAAHFMQSVDRIHRRGQKASSVHLHVLLAANTIELREFERIRTKQERQSQLVGDIAPDSVSLSAAISELESAGEQ